jgi:hypothetical protein
MKRCFQRFERIKDSKGAAILDVPMAFEGRGNGKRGVK